jgi:hypothetical protein
VKVMLLLTFKAAGMSAGQSLNLQLSYVDESGRVLRTQTVPAMANSSGGWQTTIAAPADHLGYYRVNAQLSNGAQLSGSGTRGNGYLTYAVVPNPAQRVNYGEQKSFFGLQGGFGGSWRTAALQDLGVRWELDSAFGWSSNEPSYAGQWNGQTSPDSSGSWTTYKVPTLYLAPNWAVIPNTFAYNTGALTPEGETAWANYAAKAAQAFMAKYPDRQQDIYQITWEPVQDWGYKGTNAQLLKIYQIASQAIHAVDPKAVVAGPTMGIMEEGGWPGHYQRETQSVALFQQGLGNYVDAYAAHPYYPGNPEVEQMVDRVRYMKSVVAQYGKPNMPLLGTEQGLADDGTPAGELGVARSAIRQNLIMMGEGFRFNFAFYATDYSFDSGTTVNRYGYFYNLDGGVPWAPSKVAPKPIVPAYAAMSLLLDGSTSAGAIEDMGGTRWGYRFNRPDGTQAMALWDYGENASSFTMDVGLDQVLTYDWMGNPQWMSTDNGMLTLTLSQEPTYVVVPEPSMVCFVGVMVSAAMLRRTR